ncbi:uncharacterized protein Z520_11221 [Fonsecaea multimorphosa CBS 102226]|uniref:Uncharacterized protein n=1 Tax=Fonsecaea multimorphosa CBS 102226 TaxID=1442371 RepID=A0A0D2JRU0_9EURO|nr:uncharacterized protein Z520_11221 [Fonsecaea multimorphosa CBS 102226]KIX93164.1 hypothetical protein Z520_11221 [Fonsecaea multimorphosa CBS 102226]OAL18365.1 hypothetical protein AYO22_10781 [Fonsecaea multimorphosa]
MPFRIPANYRIPQKRKSQVPHYVSRVRMGEAIAYPRGHIALHELDRWILDRGNDTDVDCLLNVVRPPRRDPAAMSETTYYVTYFQRRLDDMERQGSTGRAATFFILSLDSTLHAMEQYRHEGSRAFKEVQVTELLKHADEVCQQIKADPEYVVMRYAKWEQALTVAYNSYRMAFLAMVPSGPEQDNMVPLVLTPMELFIRGFLLMVGLLMGIVVVLT